MSTVMFVNGVNISTCNAKFWSITPAARTVTNATEILDGASIPVMMNPGFGLKEYTLKLNVYGKNRKEIWENVSRVLQLFSEVATVELGGFYDTGRQRFFKLTLTKADHTEYGPCQGGWHTLTLACTGYEYGDEMTLETEKLILNGNGGQAVTYESYVKDMKVNYSRHQTQMPTAPVFVNLAVTQTETCSDALVAGVAPEVEGKRYAMHADIRISGLCRNSVGKDIGDLIIRVREDMEPDGSYIGKGISHIEIEGKTGKIKERMANVGGDWGLLTCDMPSQLKVGFPGQKIRVEIQRLNIGTIYRPQEIYIVLGLTPVYL